MPLYPHPLSPGYWRSAAGELKHLRRLVFMALMIAACIVLSHCSVWARACPSALPFWPEPSVHWSAARWR